MANSMALKKLGVTKGVGHSEGRRPSDPRQGRRADWHPYRCHGRRAHHPYPRMTWNDIIAPASRISGSGTALRLLWPLPRCSPACAAGDLAENEARDPLYRVGLDGSRHRGHARETLINSRCLRPRIRRITGSGRIKAWVDGENDCRTGLMYERYKGHFDTDPPGDKGTLVTPLPEAEHFADIANRNGIICMLHCSGDKAMDIGLDAYAHEIKEEIQADNHAHRALRDVPDERRAAQARR